MPDAEQYINESCPVTTTGSPERQCQMPHADPVPHRSVGTWTCPSTDRTYRWCDECNEWSWTRNGRASARVNGQWLCSTEQHDYFLCPECGTFYHADDGPCCDEEDYDDDHDYEDGPGRSGECVVRCSQCNTENTIFDEISEVFVCECAARSLRERKVPLKVVAA